MVEETLEFDNDMMTEGQDDKLDKILIEPILMNIDLEPVAKEIDHEQIEKEEFEKIQKYPML
jgi:hypothetical protein